METVRVGGHYSVYVLYTNGDGVNREACLHIDDEAVSTVRHEVAQVADEWCVYLLFSCRATPTRT
jgi:hypothetical protein